MEDLSRRKSSAISEGAMPSSSRRIFANRISSADNLLYGSRFGMAKQRRATAKHIDLENRKQLRTCTDNSWRTCAGKTHNENDLNG